MKEKGLIQTYTGSGKGKSTASMGLAFRAAGRNWKILIVQFLKGDKETDMSYGELIAADRFKDNLKIIQSCDKYKVVMEHNKTEEDVRLAQATWKKMVEEITSNKYNLLILDEILPALCMKFISKKTFFTFVRDIQKQQPLLELVFTGRIWVNSIYDQIKNISDYMSDIRAVKHPFNKHCPRCKREFEYRSNFCPNCGHALETVAARKGIEF